MSTKIMPGCTCNFGFIETGIVDYGDEDIISPRKIFQVISTSGRTLATNRDEDEEMDNLNMICIRCGAPARYVRNEP